MKLEKREITLNEYDSLHDLFLMQKNLLNDFVGGLEKVSRRETRKELLRLMKETGEDLLLIRDLMENSIEDCEA